MIEKSKSVADAINKEGGQALAVAGDILSDDYINDLVKKSAEFGGGKIHIIVNNAGFTWDGVIHKVGPALPHDCQTLLLIPPDRQTTDKQWETIINLHNTAPFKLVRAAASFFRVKDGEPRNVVNISSTSGLHGNAGQVNYSVAKAGIQGLSKTIAKEWGPTFGVRANTIAYGQIATRLTSAKEQGGHVTLGDGKLHVVTEYESRF